MSRIIRALGEVNHWEEVYNQFFRATPAPGVNANAYDPIPPVAPPFIFDKFVLAIATSSVDVKPHWFLAARVKQQIRALSSNYIDVAGPSLPLQLNKTQLVVLPQVAADYKLRLDIPWWHTEMGFTIWQYVGPETDSTEDLIDTLKVDIARLEYRLGSTLE